MYMLSCTKASWHCTGSSYDVARRLEAYICTKAKSTGPRRPFDPKSPILSVRLDQ